MANNDYMSTQEVLTGIKTWVKKEIGTNIYDISANHNGAKYANLSAALGTNGANIPQSLRKGGMSVKFVQSSDNKYAQWRLMADSFSTTVANWQGVDDEPTAGSDNLVKSGGTKAQVSELEVFDKGIINYATTGIYYNKDTQKFTTNASYNCIIIPVKNGDVVSIKCKSNTNASLFALFNKKEPIGGESQDLATGTNYLQLYNNSGTLTNTDGKFLYIGCQKTFEEAFEKITINGQNVLLGVNNRLNALDTINYNGIIGYNLAGTSDIKFYNDNIVAGKKAIIVVNSGEFTSLNVLGYRSDNTNTLLGYITKVGNVNLFDINETFSYIRIYKGDSSEFDANFYLIDKVSDIVMICQKIAENEKYKEITSVKEASTLDNGLNIGSSLVSGNVAVIKVVSGFTSAINVYGVKAGQSNVLVGTISKANEWTAIQINAEYDYLRLWNATTGYSVQYCISNTKELVSYLVGDISNIKEQITLLSGLKILVLGDSFSAVPQRWITHMLNELPSDTELVNLAVSGATIKDRYTDRATYPYTSRPNVLDSSGNKNTYGCQIEKLKRLMEGTDLDEGEVQIYANSDDYPNIIILEGGQNDSQDTDTSGYISCFIKEAENVYYVTGSGQETQLGSCYIKTPINEVDRTTFAGAYRYVAEELLSLFPKALIFVVTTSNLSYWDYEFLSRKNKVAEQQKECAAYLGASIIDWHQESQINSIINYPSGDGTQNNPYQIKGSSPETEDLLHPTIAAGKNLVILLLWKLKASF